MTHEDITIWALECQLPYHWRTGEIIHLDKLERFAAKVAAAERESCAKLCDSLQDWPEGASPDDCAKAIRARGEP